MLGFRQSRSPIAKPIISGPDGRQIVSSDKAYEMEFLYSREEIRIRMDYNRRLFTGQLTLIAAASAAILSFSAKGSSVPTDFYPFFAAIGIWMNAALVLENGTNNTHIASAALFMHDILNTKYRLADTSLPVYSWEKFLAQERQLSNRLMNRNLFLLDASFILNLMLSALAALLFLYSSASYKTVIGLLSNSLFYAGGIFLILAYTVHFRSDESWRHLIPRREGGRKNDQ